MDAKETNDARMRYVAKRLRARFAQIKKRKVTVSPETTDEPMDEPLEEEKAFNNQVNQSDSEESRATEPTPEN